MTVSFWVKFYLTLCLLLASGLFSGHLKSEPLEPVEYPTDVDVDKVQLGKILFHDRRLSNNSDIACSDCHHLKNGGSNGLAPGDMSNHSSQVDVPSVLNSGNSFRLFWDGRARNLQEQFFMVMSNPNEMNADWNVVLQRLQSDPQLRKLFATTYPDGITRNNVADAVVSYERALVTPAPFDSYLKGDQDAISAKAKQGYQHFRKLGCITCHQGKNIGGNMFQHFGIVEDYFAGRPITEADLGRFNVTRDPADKHLFRVPSLRNVARTAPYFHDGSVSSLGGAVTLMAYHQLGRELGEEEIDLIVAFLETLSADPLPELLP